MRERRGKGRGHDRSLFSEKLRLLTLPHFIGHTDQLWHDIGKDNQGCGYEETEVIRDGLLN